MSDIAASNDNGNGRITLAVVVTRIDEVIIPALGRIERRQDQQAATTKENCDKITRIDTELEDMRTLKKAFIGQAVGIILTAILAILALANSLP